MVECNILDLELIPNLKVMDLRENGFDLAIRYGHGDWPGYRSEWLASADYVVVATAAFVEGQEVSGLSDLSLLPWLFEANRTEHKTWAKERSIDFDADRNRFYPTNSLVLSAVRAGYGLSLQALALVERDLEEGRLVKVITEKSDSLGYYIVTRPDQGRKLCTFIRWLRNSA